MAYSTAWFVGHRIREACKSDNLESFALFGTVEADEAHIGGKEKNMHGSKKHKVRWRDWRESGSIRYEIA